MNISKTFGETLDFAASAPIVGGVSDAQRIRNRFDLPPQRSTALYRVTSDGKGQDGILKKRCRQMLEALMIGPVYCASAVRLSATVETLRKLFGAGAIVTDWYETWIGDEYCRYGIYRLVASVELLEPCLDLGDQANARCAQ